MIFKANFLFLKEHFGFQVLCSDKGLEYRGKPDVIFVIKDFESADFNYLNSSSLMIIGPTILRYCCAMEKV